MRILILLLLAFILIQNKTYSQEKITDTVFFDYDWKICEQPLAEYYRVGTMAIFDSIIYYTGPFKDYSYDHRLLTVGNYNIEGKKDGLFTFYYPDKSVQCTGKYDQDSLLGVWRWNYPGGYERASVYFPGIEQEFKFMTYKDERGRVLLENGTGEFTWETAPIDGVHLQVVKGFFESGKRDGRWIYSFPQGDKDANLFENYDKAGKFKNGGAFSYSNDVEVLKPINFRFSPYKLQTCENLSHSDIFKLHGEADKALTMLAYLIEKKPIEIDMEGMNVDSVYTNIVQTLAWNLDLHYYTKTNKDSRIMFGIGSNGRIENITMTDCSTLEKIYIEYLLKKFKNISIPAQTGLSPAGRFTIYINAITHKEEIYERRMSTIHTTEHLLFTSVPRAELDYVFTDKMKEQKYLKRGYFIRYL